MSALLLVGLVVASAGCVAALANPSTFGGFLASVYVLAVVDVVVLVEMLSLVGEVDRVALLTAQTAVLVVSVLVVVLAPPSCPDLRGMTRVARTIRASRVLSAFTVVVALVWAYQGLLALTVAPNNWDAMTYHLARVAAWFQHGGVYWIPDAPTDRLNEFQPNAEELVLALVAVARDSWPFAIPQFVAAGALVVSTGVSSRALGFSRDASLFAALVAATVPMIVLQATTAQNDLIAAALVSCAAALILQGERRLLIVAGLAIGVAAGVKLTVVLVFPVLGLLAAASGWRNLRRLALAAVVPLLTVGSAGLLRNLEHTGSLLGNGGGRIDQQHDGAIESASLTLFRVAYRLLDLTGLGTLLGALTVAGLVAAGAIFIGLRRRGVPTRRALRSGAVWALPLVLPLLIVALAVVTRAVGEATSIDFNARAATATRFVWGVQTTPSEDLSYFGFLGSGLAVGSVVLLVLGARRRVPLEVVSLALSIPLFVVLLALYSSYNPFLGRFMLVPVALALPLVAYAWTRPLRMALVVVAAATLIGTAVGNERKPFESKPWAGGRDEALRHSVEPRVAASTAELDRRLRGTPCIVAVVSDDEPSFLLYGPNLTRDVAYAESPRAARGASTDVILGPAIDAHDLADAGWTIDAAGDYWRIARPPPATRSVCS